MRRFCALVLSISLVYVIEAYQPNCDVAVMAYFSGENCTGTATYEPVTVGCINTTQGSEERYFDDNGVYLKTVLDTKCGVTPEYLFSSYHLETRYYGVCVPTSPYNTMLKRTQSHMYPMPQPYRPPNPSLPVGQPATLVPCSDPTSCMSSLPSYYYAYYDNANNCTTPNSYKAAHVGLHGICYVDPYDSYLTYSLECGQTPSTKVRTTYIGSCEVIVSTYTSVVDCINSPLQLICENNNPTPRAPLGPSPPMAPNEPIAPTSNPTSSPSASPSTSPSTQNPTPSQMPSTNPTSQSPSSSNPSSVPSATIPTSMASRNLISSILVVAAALVALL